MIPGKCNTLTSRQCWDLDPSIPLVLRCHSTPRSNFFFILVLVFFAYHGTVGHGWLVLCLGQAFDSSGLQQAALAQRLSFSVLVRSTHGTGGPRAGKDLAFLPHLFSFCFSVFFPYTPTTRWFYLHVSAALRFDLVSTQGRSGSSSVTEGEIGHSYTIPPMFSFFFPYFFCHQGLGRRCLLPVQSCTPVANSRQRFRCRPSLPTFISFVTWTGGIRRADVPHPLNRGYGLSHFALFGLVWSKS